MTEPSYWLFVAANAVVLAIGGGLTSLSYAAYRRTGRPSLRYAVAGFGVITAGALVEAGYELLVQGIHRLDADELLLLNSVESLLLGAGLSLIFYSLRGR